MKIQVLGSGCTTCHKMYEMAQQAAGELGITESVEFITGDKGIQKIIELGSMTSPVLAIDGQIVMSGFTPDMEKMKSAIRKHIR
jgi:small redox-active disulfide protein 2